VNHEHATKRPERLTTQICRVLLFKQQHLLTCLSEFIAGDETGEASTDDDNVRVHIGLPFRLLILNIRCLSYACQRELQHVIILSWCASCSAYFQRGDVLL